MNEAASDGTSVTDVEGLRWFRMSRWKLRAALFVTVMAVAFVARAAWNDLHRYDASTADRFATSIALGVVLLFVGPVTYLLSFRWRAASLALGDEPWSPAIVQLFTRRGSSYAAIWTSTATVPPRTAPDGIILITTEIGDDVLTRAQVRGQVRRGGAAVVAVGRRVLPTNGWVRADSRLIGRPGAADTARTPPLPPLRITDPDLAWAFLGGHLLGAAFGGLMLPAVISGYWLIRVGGGVIVLLGYLALATVVVDRLERRWRKAARAVSGDKRIPPTDDVTVVTACRSLGWGPERVAVIRGIVLASRVLNGILLVVLMAAGQIGLT